MSQRNIMLVMLVSIMAVFGILVVYDIKANHRLEKIFGKETNWQWKDNWGSKHQPKIQDPPKKEQEESKSQVTASDYNDAVKKSEQFGMPIAIIFRAEWCHWCKKLKEETLTDSKTKSMMKNYVFLEVDVDLDTVTAKKFGVLGLPSYVITNSKGDKLKSGSGYKDSNSFSEWLNEPTMFK